MVEGEGCSRPTGDPRESEPEAPGARGPGPGLPEPAADLPALFATLGRHLEGHAPEEVVVLLREELARREFEAYVNGWRDAADQYEPVLEEARRIAQARRLRLVGRTPGQAAVIPFPHGDGRDAAGGDPGDATPGQDGPRPAPDGSRAPAPRRPEGSAPPAGRTGAGAGPGPGAPERRRTRDAQDHRPAAPRRERDGTQGAPGRRGAKGKEQDPEARDPGTTRPGLVAKSPHSRVPTIPPLPARRRAPGDAP
ncbi:hypothetical protein [Streptomyces lavendofoliae]|uniref:hypothetical protein n=1 Tax=Streptomyces lavendofoliae TaxID=67314 RepID=UPI00300E91D0